MRDLQGRFSSPMATLFVVTQTIVNLKANEREREKNREKRERNVVKRKNEEKQSEWKMLIIHSV